MKKGFKKILGLAALVFAGKKAFDIAKKVKEERDLDKNEEEKDTFDVEN